MDEEELGRSVLCILGVLLLPDLGEVPHVQPAVGAGAGQDRLIVGRPLHLGRNYLISFSFNTDTEQASTHLENFILVRFKRVQLQLEIPKVPEGNLSIEDEVRAVRVFKSPFCQQILWQG